MNSLADKIKYYATKYYEGEPEISDASFDLLVEQLKSEDPDNPLLQEVGWGYRVNCDPNKELPHKFEVSKFEDKIKDSSNINIDPGFCVVTPKIDGGSVCCYYVDGKLDYAITRGDGVTGFDVTDKLKYLVPSELRFDPTFTGLVRGEITMKTQVFNEKYSDRYTSNRNLCVGNMRRTSISVPEIKDMDFIAYTVRGTSKLYDLSAEKSWNIYWLKSNWFHQVDIIDYDSDKWTDEKLRYIIKHYTEYPIDGVVITSEDYQKLDDGTAVPTIEVAYKTEADGAIVKVKNIAWQFTSTGRLNPVVEFDPVLLSGAWIRRATAFNVEYVRGNKLGIGSDIRINRSGEVIPDIQEVLTEGQSNIPEVCPECGGKLETVGAYLYCKNPDCQGKAYADLFNWVYTIAGVKGLSWTTYNKIFVNLGINCIDDLYAKIDQIDSDDVMRFSGIGWSVFELVKQFKSKLQSPVDADRFLVACNILGCGWTQATRLAQNYQLIFYDPLGSEWESKIWSIKGVNSTVKQNLINGIHGIRKNMDYIQVNPLVEASESDEAIEKTIIAVTGKLSVTRSKFFEEMAQYGYVEGSINKAKYLVTDNPNSGSSKNKKAKELGVQVISETDFRALINNVA